MGNRELPGVHHFRGPTPLPKTICEGPQQLSLPGGPEWSQPAPGIRTVWYNGMEKYSIVSGQYSIMVWYNMG